MISFISLLFIYLFYFALIAINFANLYFWIMKISASLSPFFLPLLEIFYDFSVSSDRNVKKSSPFTKIWEDIMLNYEKCRASFENFWLFLTILY